MKLSKALGTALLTPLLLAGCNLEQLLSVVSPTTVVVHPDSVSLAKNAQVTAVADAFNAQGTPLPGYFAV